MILAPHIRYGLTAGASGPVLSGTPYPGQVLASTAADQWLLDGVPISGQTDSSYTVRVNDIGREISQAGSNVMPVWHPKDEAGVQAVYLANMGVLNSGGHPAGDNADVATWQDQSSHGWHAEILASPPIKAKHNEIAGNNVLEFNNKRGIILPTEAQNLFRNDNYSYVMMAVKPMSLSGIMFFTATEFGGVIGIYCDYSIAVLARDEYYISTDINFDYQVITGEYLWLDGELNVRINGSFMETTSMDSSPSSDAPAEIYIGSPFDDIGALMNLSSVILISGNTKLSTEARWRLENYLALLTGGSISPP